MQRLRFGLHLGTLVAGAFLISCLPPQGPGDPNDPASVEPGDHPRASDSQLDPADVALEPASAEFQSFQQQGLQPIVRAAAAGGAESSLGYVPPPLHISGQVTGTRTQVFAATPGLLQTFPASYDLRTQSKLSAIRDQGACGSCWAFATFAAGESQLLPGESKDFSEEHLNDWSGFDVGACNGGNAAMSIAYMSRWAGPVAEVDDPYTAGASSRINQNKPAVKHLQSALTIPDRTGPLDNQAIKSAVTTYGAVMTTMRWDSSCWKTATNAFYNGTAGSYANHAVAIVGWDDAYPAANFLKTPPGNGAFLVRNSWGTSWGESGYFRISYYDAYVGIENNVFDVLASTSDFTGVYQYDKYGATAMLSSSGTTHYQANIYTATGDSPISAVSFYTLVPDTTADVEVWMSPTTGNPTSGTRVGTLAGIALPFAGYHTVSLASLGAQTQAGKTFSVSLRLTASQVKIPLEYPYAGYSSQVQSRAGLSFLATVGGGSAQWWDAYLYRGNVPVKVFVGASTSCDDGNPCTVDSGTPGNCKHTVAPRGTVCRAAAGPCDKAETCDGKSTTCPTDALVASGTRCRAAADLCDTPATCTGKSAECPANGFKPSTTVCRAASGGCDVAETCTGSSAACPADKIQPQNTVCHSPISACDNLSVCDGTAKACPGFPVKPKGTLCRAAAGDCDKAEVCDGMKATCPTDNFLAKGTQCRAATGACDVAAACTGKAAACPANTFKTKTTVCRAAAGPCDVAETCTGNSAACPSDAFRAKGYVCKASPKTLCSGVGPACTTP